MDRGLKSVLARSRARSGLMVVGGRLFGSRGSGMMVVVMVFVALRWRRLFVRSLLLLVLVLLTRLLLLRCCWLMSSPN